VKYEAKSLEEEFILERPGLVITIFTEPEVPDVIQYFFSIFRSWDVMIQFLLYKPITIPRMTCCVTQAGV
jgi:hypothetical protein